jgi:hypothetical protein
MENMMKTKKPTLDKANLVVMKMPEWRDGQPGCMTCLREMEIGSRVFQDKKTNLIYCVPCVEKKGGVK